jgi:hypothetical protein
MSNKCYALEQSPLYRLRNRRKLATLLKLDERYFYQEHEYAHEYHSFSKPKPNGDGMRKFTVPSDDLKIIQKQVSKLLSRIETPDWVMSGKKSCSYITNAKFHLENSFIKTMDISQFYDSAQRAKIYDMFLNNFHMEHDIAWLMTELVTYNGCLPTGSPSSQLIIYWAYSSMFSEIEKISKIYGCSFTLYVDDMTFSSNKSISRKLREDVSVVLRRNNLKAKAKKDHYYQAKDFKIVTGVGMRNGNMIVPNAKRKTIILLYSECREHNDIKKIEKLNGMLCALRQIEPNIFPEIFNYVKRFENELKAFSKKRFYIKRRRASKEKLKRNCNIFTNSGDGVKIC